MINNLINKIKNFQMTNLEIKNKKSSIYVFILIIIKMLCGCSLIFDLLITLFAVILMLYISEDIDNNNNIMDNASIKNIVMMGLITGFIGKSNVIKKNSNIPIFFSNMFKSAFEILTIPKTNEVI